MTLHCLYNYSWAALIGKSDMTLAMKATGFSSGLAKADFVLYHKMESLHASGSALLSRLEKIGQSYTFIHLYCIPIYNVSYSL
jgi:hypothetical protein